MPDTSSEDPPSARPFWHDSNTQRWLATAGVLTAGLVVGGYLLGDGLTRAKAAERAVTVRGVAERDVLADLAVWTLSYSATAPDMAGAQAKVDRDSQAIGAFFKELGFPAEALQPAGVNVTSSTDEARNTSYTVRQRLTLRTTDIKRAEAAVGKQFELVRRGVFLEEGSGIAYTFTRLNAIKPEMVATATKDARKAAEQFAEDSGSSVGGIKDATQGYFEITARDGDAGGWGQSDTPFKKVRVVTTVNYYLR
jgi:hypothetical protein